MYDFTNINTKLTVLTKIKPGDKVCFRQLIPVPGNSIFSSFIRYYDGESRETNLNDLNDLLKSIRSSVSKFGIHHLYILLDNLEKAIEGLKNLKVTYEDDTVYVSKLDKIISEFESIKMSTKVQYETRTKPIQIKNNNVPFVNFTPGSHKMRSNNDYNSYEELLNKTD